MHSQRQLLAVLLRLPQLVLLLLLLLLLLLPHPARLARHCTLSPCLGRWRACVQCGGWLASAAGAGGSAVSTWAGS